LVRAAVRAVAALLSWIKQLSVQLLLGFAQCSCLKNAGVQDRAAVWRSSGRHEEEFAAAPSQLKELNHKNSSTLADAAVKDSLVNISLLSFARSVTWSKYPLSLN
jgi:hypothetical protein